MINRIETHKKAVEWAACNLIENGITTKSCNEVRGIDLILDNGKTISVRGIGEEVTSPLMNGSLDQMKADYIIIVTNLNYRCIRRIYIMTLENAKEIAQDSPYKINKRHSWFMRPKNYRNYHNNHSVIVEDKV